MSSLVNAAVFNFFCDSSAAVGSVLGDVTGCDMKIGGELDVPRRGVPSA